MKIENFEIRDYGPLPDLGIINLDTLNLFYGRNESGKTLIVDALIKLLMGNQIIHKEKLNRINEKPIGYVNIIDNKGKKQTLKGKDLLPDILNILPLEFYNVFVIRDSDLTIQDQKDFYNNITDRLLGLRINDIQKLDNELLELGKLTPSGKFRDISPEKLNSRLKEARKYIKNINNLVDKIRTENLDELEKDRLKINKNIEITKKNIENYEKARNREKYELGIDALNKLKNAKNQFDKLLIFSDIDKQNWRDNQNNIKIYENEKAKLELKRQQYMREFNEITIKIEELKNNLRIPEKAKTRLEEIIKPEIRKYKAETGELKKQGIINKFFMRLWFVSLILFGAFFLVGFSFNSLFSIFMGILFAILTVGSLIFFKFPYIRKKGFIDGFVERINLELKEFGLNGQNYKEVSEKILNFETEYEKKIDKLNELKNRKLQLDNNILTILNENIPYSDARIKESVKAIDLIRSTSKVESLKEYEEQLVLKRETERIIEKQKSKLTIFNIEGENDDEKIIKWETELAKLEKFKDEVKEITYDNDQYFLLKNNKDKLEQKKEELDSKYNDLKNNLFEIERSVNSILNDCEEYLYCTVISDLEIIKSELSSFIKENKNMKENVLEIRNIYNRIKNKGKEKISKLLSKESSITKYFKEITNGIYEEIIFTIEPFEIKVKRKDNQILNLNQLSGGTFDQLYLAVRLALGEKLLKENQGFFILDDPFIKSDSLRLVNQINLIKKLSSLGWQVLYFTCKDEILVNLNQEINNNEIKFIELNNLIL